MVASDETRERVAEAMLNYFRAHPGTAFRGMADAAIAAYEAARPVGLEAWVRAQLDESVALRDTREEFDDDGQWDYFEGRQIAFRHVLSYLRSHDARPDDGGGAQEI